MFNDKQLTCVDCGSEFVFTSGEQEFFQQKGFTNEPKRCQLCRRKNKQQDRDRRDPRQRRAS